MTADNQSAHSMPVVPPAPNNASPCWSDARLLGFSPMDDTHKEFFQVVREMLAATDANALAAIERFEVHALAHFGQEDGWMESTDFPARGCHMDEHRAVLASTREVKDLFARGVGRCGLLQDFANYLLEWFPGHSDYLDSALAGWMAKRAYGGRPVVFRRRLEFPSLA